MNKFQFLYFLSDTSSLGMSLATLFSLPFSFPSSVNLACFCIPDPYQAFACGGVRQRLEERQVPVMSFLPERSYILKWQRYCVIILFSFKLYSCACASADRCLPSDSLIHSACCSECTHTIHESTITALEIKHLKGSSTPSTA